MILLAWLVAASMSDPKPITPGQWITQADYPAEAVRVHAAGTVAFRLTVDANGRVVDCVVTGPSGWAVLDTTTCALLRERARFNPDPANDGPRSFSSRMEWQLPRQSSATPMIAEMDYPPEALRRHWEGLVGFQIAISAEGEATGCRITQSSGHPVLDQATCDMMLKRGHFLPAHDANGQAAAGRYDGQITWKLPQDRAAPN